jgi:hypothetical protein
MPLPSGPSRSAGVPSKLRSAVEEEFRPIFSSSRVTANPSAPARTTKALMRWSSRANTRNVDACDPFVIHCLDPLMRPSAYRVRIALASEPEPDSVSANAPSSSPEASAATYGDPWSSSGSVQALVCTATVTPTPASARESSSSTSTYERKSAPAPPCSSGTHTPISPSSPSSANSSRGKVCSRSHRAAWGATCSSANRLASSRISRCSGVSSCRLMPGSAAAPASRCRPPRPPPARPRPRAGAAPAGRSAAPPSPPGGPRGSARRPG